MRVATGHNAVAVVSASGNGIELSSDSRLKVESLRLSLAKWSDRLLSWSILVRSCNGTVKEVVPCNPGVGHDPRQQTSVLEGFDG